MASELNEILDAVKKIQELVEPLRTKSSSKSSDDEVYILELMIAEIKRADDWLNNAYVRVKTKTLTFLGGSLALLTFLYADGDTFIPEETYGKIVYFGALGLVLGSLVALFVSLHPRRWEFSLDVKVPKSATPCLFPSWA